MTRTTEERYAHALLRALGHIQDAMAVGVAEQSERARLTVAHGQVRLVYDDALARAREGQSARKRRKVPKADDAPSGFRRRHPK